MKLVDLLSIFDDMAFVIQNILDNKSICNPKYDSGRFVVQTFLTASYFLTKIYIYPSIKSLKRCQIKKRLQILRNVRLDQKWPKIRTKLKKWYCGSESISNVLKCISKLYFEVSLLLRIMKKWQCHKFLVYSFGWDRFRMGQHISLKRKSRNRIRYLTW